MSSQQDAQSLWQKDRDHFIHPYTDFAVFKDEGSQIISRASGVHVADAEGTEYLDAIAGLWCVNIGHGREEMADAIRDQVMTMQYYNPFGHSSRADYRCAALPVFCQASRQMPRSMTQGSAAQSIAVSLAARHRATVRRRCLSESPDREPRVP